MQNETKNEAEVPQDLPVATTSIAPTIINGTLMASEDTEVKCNTITLRSLCGGLEEDAVHYSRSLQPDVPPILRGSQGFIPVCKNTETSSPISTILWTDHKDQMLAVVEFSCEGDASPNIEKAQTPKKRVNDDTKALMKWPALILVCVLGFGGSYNYDMPGAIGVGGSTLLSSESTADGAVGGSNDADSNVGALTSSLAEEIQSTMTNEPSPPTQSGKITTIQGLFLTNGRTYNQKMNQSLYSSYSYPNMFFSIICGVLIDKIIGLRKSLLLFQVLTLTGVIVTALSAVLLQEFSLMLVGRVIFGIGSESMWIIQSSTINRWFASSEEEEEEIAASPTDNLAALDDMEVSPVASVLDEDTKSKETPHHPPAATVPVVQQLQPNMPIAESQNVLPDTVAKRIHVGSIIQQTKLTVDTNVRSPSISPVSTCTTLAASAAQRRLAALTPIADLPPAVVGNTAPPAAPQKKVDKKKTNHGAALAFGIMLSATRFQTSFAFWALPRMAAAHGVSVAIGLGIVASLFSFTCGVILAWYDAFASRLGILGADHNRDIKEMDDASPKETLALKDFANQDSSPTVVPSSKASSPSYFSSLLASAKTLGQLPFSFWLLGLVAILLYGSVLPFVGIAKNIFEVKYATEVNSPTTDDGQESSLVFTSSGASSGVDEYSSEYVPSAHEISDQNSDIPHYDEAEALQFRARPFDATASSTTIPTKKGLSESEAATMISIFQIICAAGSPVMGAVLDRTGMGQVWLLVAASILCLSSFLLITTPIPALAAAVSMATGYSIFCATLWPIVPLACPPKLRGLGYGLLAAMNNCGMATIPLISGVILDAYSGSSKSSSAGEGGSTPQSSSLPPFSAYQRVLALHCCLQGMAMMAAIALIIYYSRGDKSIKFLLRRALWATIGRLAFCKRSNIFRTLMRALGEEDEMHSDIHNNNDDKSNCVTICVNQEASLHQDGNASGDTSKKTSPIHRYTTFNSNRASRAKRVLAAHSTNALHSNCVTPMSVSNRSITQADLNHSHHGVVTSGDSKLPPSHRPPLSPMSTAHSAGSSTAQPIMPNGMPSTRAVGPKPAILSVST